ncbi:DUF421 domain-containing protein [Kroppenstedtia guangzhouensis]|jgi:uncharacterized membrane protein YcaP (DUF421 family)|uniref:DUF421 domain-containing protein n=1 Tax=Kroppenstedtia guangzhouensis TaxID=1274356 RepID=A0ABQ1GFY7_9BACL|nr:DUF421 domain-containing protein [Kroppenstedtia guangzhouensis]GGA43089.1 DUF421 domain-containing protein [Kroppenstedtia guangzhouensis]
MLEIVLRALITFPVLLLLTRLMGKKQMSQLTFFNYVTGITIGTIAASMTIDRDVPFLHSLTGLISWVLLTILATWLTLNSHRARVVLDGGPTLVIKKGKILKRSLKSLRLNMEDLGMMLREKDIFSIADVETAVFEANGKLSVIKKPGKQGATKEDLGVALVQPKYIPTNLVVDGQILQRNLQELNLSPGWLETQLKQAGTSLDQVFYAQIKSDGTLYIDKRQDPARPTP